MAIGLKKLTGAMIHEIFGMLMEHPEGLSTRDIWERLKIWQAQEFGSNGNKNQILPSFEQASFRCVAPIRAGWLQIDHHHWSLSEEGKKAYHQYSDPVELMNQAARYSVRGWLSVHLPRSYSFAGRLKDQIQSEYGAARRIGFRRLVNEAFAKASPWQDVLPLQSPRKFVFDDSTSGRFSSLIEYLKSLDMSYQQGGHAIYLTPDALKQTALKTISEGYPSNAGIKIVKNEGGLDDSGYVNSVAKGDSMIHLRLVHSHRQLTLVANLLFVKGLGPRLYDLVELQWGSGLWTAYVLEHVSGGVPTMAECEDGIEQLRKLDRDGVLKVILPEGFNDEEFKCPNCTRNALVDEQRNFKYIDFQNFFLANYESFLTTTALKAAEESHFGDKSFLRGGKYLYQTVPGVSLPGKRGINTRIEALKTLMESCGVSVNEKLVLDFGCNIGMMIGQYLKLGAKWCHGWDRARVTPHTEKLLLALGCTRFSTTGGDIIQAQPVKEDLPAFLRGELDGCVISYLAVRAHIGWLDAIATIPWSFLIYEGHEGESLEDFEKDITQLRSLTDFEIGAVSEYVDGDSDPRTIAILIKKSR
jgi:hypothetical protein